MTLLVRPEVRMSRDIAVQFRHVPRERAAKEVAEHIRLFWTPAMITKLIECADDAKDELDPLVVDAVGLLR